MNSTATMKAQPQGKSAPGSAGQTGDLLKFLRQMRYWAELTDPGVGYDQGDVKRSNLKNGGTVDCSSLVILCLRKAGFQTGNATYTGDMRSELTQHGWAVTANNGHRSPRTSCSTSTITPLCTSDPASLLRPRGMRTRTSAEGRPGTRRGTKPT